MKRQVMALLMSAMIVLQATAALAESEKQPKAQFEITSMGIMQGDENGDYHWEEKLTRAEFAAVMVRLCDYEELTKIFDGKSQFSDVEEDAWYLPFINTVVRTNLMNGMEDGRFYPESKVTFEQAVKTIMVCLGYSRTAEENGGYPDGYIQAAASCGLLYNADTSEPFTRGKLAKLLYNALDIKVIQHTANGIYKLQEGKTLREILMGTGEEDGEKFTVAGIVNANYYTYLNEPNTAIETDEIQIGTERYKVSDTISTEEYLGQEVEAYGQVIGGTKVITSVKATKNNQVIEAVSDDISDMTADGLVLWENEKRRNIKFHHDAKIIYNSGLCSEITQDILRMHDGAIKLVDHDHDNYYDVILIKDYLHLRVDQVTEKGIRLAANHKYRNMNFISIDFEDSSKKYKITDGDGNELTMEQIQKDDIISLGTDQYNSNYEIIVSSQKINGKIESINDDFITISGEKYDYCIEDKSLLQAGNTVTAYVAFNGKIADLSQMQSEQKYGYIISASYTDEQAYSVRMILPGILKETQEDAEEETDDPNASKIAVLSAKNKELAVLFLKDKVNVDGKNKDAEKALKEISGRLICYETDTDGKIRKVTYPEKIGTAFKKVYNTYERTFGKTGGGAFGVTEATQVICIPKDNGQAISNDDYLVNVQMNNGQTYEVEGFDWNADTKRADIIVLQASMNAQTGANITRRDPIGMIVEKADIVNENGEIASVFTILAEGQQKEYCLAEGIPNTRELENLNKGDLVQYSLDGDGNLEGMNLIRSFSGDIINEWTDQYGENERYTGYIVKVQPDIVAERLNKFAYQLDVSMTGPQSGADTTFYVVENGTPPIFIYEPGQDRVRAGTIDDLSGGYSRVFIDSASMSVKAVVLIDE